MVKEHGFAEKDQRDIDSIVDMLRKERVIFLLGAGASAAAGLPTMTTFFREEYGKEFVDSLAGGTDYRFGTQDVTEAERNQTELLKMLFYLASLRQTDVCYDLEVVFELIHEVEELLFEKVGASKKLMGLYKICETHPQSNFSDFRRYYEGGNKGINRWIEDLNKAIRTLRDRMYARYLIQAPSPQITGVWETYEKVFSACGIIAPVIFTTNYDTVFETLCNSEVMKYELVNGVKHKKLTRVFDLNSYLRENVENPLYLFKMHGSVTWERKEKEILDYYPVRGEVQRVSIPTIGKPSAIVEPVLSKSESAPPFSHMYAIFEKVLREVRACVSIGFSFRDERLFDLLDGVLKDRHNLRLLCVAPDDEYNSVQGFDLNANIKKLVDKRKNAVWLKERFESGPLIRQIRENISLGVL